MKRPSAKLIVAALAVAFTGVSSQSVATHSWGGYHWARTSNPFTLKIGDNLSAAWKPILATTSHDWSTNTTTFPTVLNTTIVPGKSTKQYKPTPGQVEVCNSTYGRNGWLGIAQIWLSGTHITQGTTKLNDTYFNTQTYNTLAWRNLVSCQEVGHTFGLDHQDETFDNPNLNTCMDYTNSPGSNQHPNAHDYEELSIIYAHTDTTTTVAQSTASAAALPRDVLEHDYNLRAQWGQLVKSSRNGLKEVYVLDLGRGNKLATFVRWAEGEGRGR